MGVMIKGLEMPKNCMGCSTKCDLENRKCNIDGHVFEETFSVVTSRRDKDCPLVEIGPQKPMVEIDLYSVIKQKYIEREVLEKIRAEIEKNSYPIVHGVNNHELGMTLQGILQIIDKYKKEGEQK